jgi:hypothetical protein
VGAHFAHALNGARQGWLGRLALHHIRGSLVMVRPNAAGAERGWGECVRLGG